MSVVLITIRLFSPSSFISKKWQTLNIFFDKHQTNTYPLNKTNQNCQTILIIIHQCTIDSNSTIHWFSWIIINIHDHFLFVFTRILRKFHNFEINQSNKHTARNKMRQKNENKHVFDSPIYTLIGTIMLKYKYNCDS